MIVKITKVRYILFTPTHKNPKIGIISERL